MIHLSTRLQSNITAKLASCVLLLSLCISLHSATLEFSTYLGGDRYDGLFAVVVDKEGNAFVAGGSSSTNTFPLLKPLQETFGGGLTDGVIVKFDPNGRLLFSTFFGGAGLDYINALALDKDGNLLFAGETHSTDLPTTEDAFQFDYAGGSAIGFGDGFFGKLSPDGSQLLYCSYFGGSGDERINGIALDSNGNLWVTGQTDSRNIPLKSPFQASYAGGESDGFVAKFGSDFTNLLFATYLGGSNRDQDQKIAVDAAGFIYVGGSTLSTDFPVTPGSFQTSHEVVEEIGENSDAFISKLTPDGSTLVYSTYMGSALNDAAYDIAVDAEGRACITGEIRAIFSGIEFGFQSTPGLPGVDAYVVKLTPDGSDFEWFSYLGGSGEDYGYGIVLDHAGNIFVTGITDSSDFPTRDAPQALFGGGPQDAFVAKVSADGMTLIYSTFLGGSGHEWGYGITADADGNLLAVGQTESTDFPIRNAIQGTNASVRTIQKSADAYLVKFTPALGSPLLHVARSGDFILISWSTFSTGFTLETTATISPSPLWRPVSAAPLVVGDQYTVVQRIDAAGQFFRLQRP